MSKERNESIFIINGWNCQPNKENNGLVFELTYEHQSQHVDSEPKKTPTFFIPTQIANIMINTFKNQLDALSSQSKK